MAFPFSSSHPSDRCSSAMTRIGYRLAMCLESTFRKWRARQDSEPPVTSESELRRFPRGLADAANSRCEVARPAGLEPATPGLEGCVPVAEAACVSIGCEDCHAVGLHRVAANHDDTASAHADQDSRARARARSRNVFLSTLPTFVRGSSARISTRSGSLNLARPRSARN